MLTLWALIRNGFHINPTALLLWLVIDILLTLYTILAMIIFIVK